MEEKMLMTDYLVGLKPLLIPLYTGNQKTSYTSGKDSSGAVKIEK
jgi:hypothetical protein